MGMRGRGDIWNEPLVFPYPKKIVKVAAVYITASKVIKK